MLCKLLQRVQRHAANTAPWLIDYAPEGHIVCGINKQPEIGDDVFDLFAVIELETAVYAVFNASPNQCFFKYT